MLFYYFKDSNILTGLRYFRGGADGLIHEGLGYEILRNLFSFNLMEALRGGEDIFYFMPGLRYFVSISKFLFGDTSYGYVLISFLLPFFLFKFLRNIISEKIAFYLIISFLFIPIFENMGFGHFNYIHQVVRNHAETFSIFLIIYCLSKFTNKNFIKKANYKSIFLYCLILSFSAFCRPNFFPTTTLLFLYILIICYQNYIRLIFSAFIGYGFILLPLLHNIYYGGDYSLFTKSVNIHLLMLENVRSMNFLSLENNIIINQILKWNPFLYFHRLLFLLFVIFCIFKSRNNLIINVLFLCCISQHSVLILTHPDSRYAYLAWLLTFILFAKLFYENNPIKYFYSRFYEKKHL